MFIVINENSDELRRSGIRLPIRCRSSGARHSFLLVTINIGLLRSHGFGYPLPLVVVLALLQNGILLAIVIVIGMMLSERIGLQMPLVRAWATGETRPKGQAILLPGLLVGAAVGVVMVGVDAIFFLRHLPEAMHSSFEIPVWKRLLAGIVYGGITEELLMRLFLLSLVAWLVGRWWKAAEGKPATGAFWAAIIVVAVLFGLGHLPATAAMCH